MALKTDAKFEGKLTFEFWKNFVEPYHEELSSKAWSRWLFHEIGLSFPFSLGKKKI